jgi:hypothetical protein
MYGEPENTRRKTTAQAPTSIAPVRQAQTETVAVIPNDAGGCNWIEEHRRQWHYKQRKFMLAPVFCHKLVAEGSQYCPKHKMMAEWQAETLPQSTEGVTP